MASLAELEHDPHYKKIVERLEKQVSSTINPYVNSLLLEDEETSRKKASQATESDIAQEIDAILGSSKEWCSEGEEAQFFKKNILIARYVDTTAAMQVLPPVYVSDDPLPTENKSGFVCAVNLVAKNFNMSKAIKCEAHWTADEFADQFIQKMNVAHDFQKTKEEWFFKAKGSAEYLYGKHKMTDFEYIRRCLKKGVKADLGLYDRSHIISELDPTDQLLKTITYDVEYAKHEDILPSHESMSVATCSWDKMKMISLWDLDRPTKIKVRGIDNLFPSDDCIKAVGDLNECVFFIATELYHGGLPISKMKFTRAIVYSGNQLRYNQSLVFDDLLMSHLPRETKVLMTLYARQYKLNDAMLTANDCSGTINPKDYPVGYIVFPLFDFKGVMRSGLQRFKCWLDHSAKNLSTCAQNDENDAFVLTCDLDKFAVPVSYPAGTPTKKFQDRYAEWEKKQKDKVSEISGDKLKSELDRLLKQDVLYELSEEDKFRLWTNREALKQDTRAIGKILLSVPANQPWGLHLSHVYLHECAQPSAIDALELLNFNFADHKVREYSIKCLNGFSDSELENFVLQLVQSLKFELYHDTALARFLLQRGLRMTHTIGQILFWNLKSEIHSPTTKERHGLILEEYLKNCGSHRRELLKQNFVIEQLLAIAMKIKKTKGAERLNVLRHELKNNFKHPPKFKLPLSPRMEVTGVIADKCKVMDSKKLPLWLAFKNADTTGDPILTIFKAGDDLRQDLLTLQMLRIMDKLWRQTGYDFHMQPYGCVTTGDMTGMIEVVLNSDTIANITSAKGSSTMSKAVNAFAQDPLYVWLKKHNPDAKHWDGVVDNFALSCAGYCCATFVLGIGDRHNDNIMLNKKGELFHIDFGHFLGHFKSFAGIKRETAPFVFTQMYAYVLGNEGAPAFDKFKEMGAKAFSVLRKNGNMMMVLFQLMLATGIPELETLDDILWLRKCLVMTHSEDDANKFWSEKVKESLSNTRARINDAVHIIAHK